MKILIVGAGGHGQVVADILLAGRQNNPAGAEPVGFLDDDPALHQRAFLGLRVLGPVASLPEISHEAIIVAIGHNRTRQQLCQRLQVQGERLATAVHPRAVMSPGVDPGPGTMVCAGVVVNTGARIGRGVILNTGCTVDHHNHLGDFVHVAPGAHLGGDVQVGDGALIGIGAIVLPQRRIGAWSIIGAGAVVTRDVPAAATVIGVPARLVQSNHPDLETF